VGRQQRGVVRLSRIANKCALPGLLHLPQKLPVFHESPFETHETLLQAKEGTEIGVAGVDCHASLQCYWILGIKTSETLALLVKLWGL
jgi:hypothetical protein